MAQPGAPMLCRYVESPLGPLLLAGDSTALRYLKLPRDGKARTPEPGWIPDPGAFQEATRQLEAYFSGSLKRFSLPLAPRGTPFQQDIWAALREVPYGTTVSYGELARRAGRPRSARAVGAAMAANPLPILIPCHRVIGSDGSLTGFGGGLEAKRLLLALEKEGRP